ncbi:MAG TPA: HAD-IIA family hydrolase [Acidimicrobiales bacterium]|nr:HAD-IIA family hydrolase [Acidimicrobiales bacterium]
MTWLLDLDGVVWLAEEPIPGSAEAIEALRRTHGQRVVFLTNNSSATLADYLAKLERCGIPTGPDDLITSAQAAATLVGPDETALVCAGPGVGEALAARGVTTVRDGAADVVVVGWHRDFDYARLTAAFDALHGGARLVGTNDDATYPTPDGPLPGGGAILAAVAYASGATPTIAGKPFAPMADLLQARVDDALVMVGDRPSTDGRFAERVGVPFALVLSGVTRPDAPPSEPAPAQVAADLAALVAQVYGG